MYVRELDLFVTVMLLEDTPAVLSLGNLCQEFGYNYHWTSGQIPHLIKNDRKINCNTANFLPFVVPGLPTSSSTSSSPTSLTSSSQETVIDTEIPATRGESTDEIARGDPSRESAEIENPNKNDDDEELQSDELQCVPDWLQEFEHGLVDESVPEHRDTFSSSHELPLEHRTKVVPSLPAPSTLKPEEREFVVDSGASMHMISKKDLNSAELETVTTSRSPTTVITANGEMQTHEEASLRQRIGYILDFESPRGYFRSFIARKALR